MLHENLVQPNFKVISFAVMQMSSHSSFMEKKSKILSSKNVVNSVLNVYSIFIENIFSIFLCIY